MENKIMHPSLPQAIIPGDSVGEAVITMGLINFLNVRGACVLGVAPCCAGVLCRARLRVCMRQAFPPVLTP